jgi:hypothetical protein
MQAVAAASRTIGKGTHDGGKIAIAVNGQPISTLSVAAGDTARVDLSERLHTGANTVELVPAAGNAGMVAVAFATHWLPWTRAVARTTVGLRFGVAFDRTQGRPGENIECVVETGRSSGFGMLLSEAGLPPGADVDRASLEQALHDPHSRLYRYEVLPDRVVLYLWPGQEGGSLRFQFRPRFAMDAKSAPSLLYDYYNPEAIAEAAPVLFHIR